MPLRKMQAQTMLPQEAECPLPVEEAIRRLESDEPAQRQAAARSLAGVAEAALALCDRFTIEKDNPTREALAVAIMRTGGSAAIARLLPLLSSEDAAQRNTVIEILQALPDEVAPHMRALLDNADSDVRIFAVNVLEALRHPQVEEWLIGVITSDQHVNVVATALDLIGEVGTEAAVPSLTSVKARFAGEPYVAFAAANALKRIGA